MRETVLIAAAAGTIALILGAAGMYFLMPAQEAPEVDTAGSEDVRIDAVDGAAHPLGKTTPAANSGADADLNKQLTEASISLDKLSEENSDLRGQRDQLAKDKQTLDGKITGLETRVKELEGIAAGPNRLIISYGKWAELKEVRGADWEGLGDAYMKMTPLLKAYAEATAQGKQLDADTAKELRAQNDRLVEHYLKVRGKLPTNGRANGEFTHPINLVNYLAAQLEALAMPLTDQQKQQLAELGEEYDARWDKLLAGYTETTWALQKLIDECDLKQWFYDAMFAVTTAEQHTAALPPELQGLIGLDLYSPGLILQAYMEPLRAPDLPALKIALKDTVSQQLAIPRATLDGAEYIFDDWLNALQLEPTSQLAARQWRTLAVLQAGKAELANLQALERDVIVDEEARKRIRGVQDIVVPQLVKQE